MTPETLKYIEACANERENASVQKLSCADVRALLAERAVLLEALHTIRAQSVGPDWTTETAFRWIKDFCGETIVRATS